MSVKFEVVLRCLADGHECTHQYDCEDENADSQVFMWEEGNYACDCNRSILKSWPCSGEKIIVVSLRRDGEEVYTEL